MVIVKRADLDDLKQVNLFLKEMDLIPLSESSFCESYRNVYLFLNDDIVVACICFIILNLEVELEAIYVVPEYRGNGFGSQLMEKMFEVSNLYHCESIFLEVRESNDIAYHLYSGHGFVEVNRRENYYGKEAGIVMKKELR